MVKHDASGKKGKLLCCKRIFDRIKANMAEIQLKKHQNVQKNTFFEKSSRSEWVKCISPLHITVSVMLQSESKCEIILIKMTLICMKMKLNAELIFI